MTFGMEKLEWLGYTMVKKLTIRLLVLRESTNKTDRHSMTALAALMHSIVQ